MLHHVSVGVADVERAAKFYDAVLGALGFKRTAQYLPFAIAYGEGVSEFWIQRPHNQAAPSVGNGAHIGFSARSKDAVHRFHAAAVANGGADEGAPGPRPDYGPEYYGAFAFDIDGNKVEAVLHPRPKAMKAKPAMEAKKKAKAASRPRRSAKARSRRPAKRARSKARRR